MTRLLLLATLVAAASARRELRQSDVEYGYDAFKQRFNTRAHTLFTGEDHFHRRLFEHESSLPDDKVQSFVARMHTQITPELTSSLEERGSLTLHTVVDGDFLMHGTRAHADSLRAQPEVRTVVPLLPELKVTPHFEKLLPAHPASGNATGHSSGRSRSHHHVVLNVRLLPYERHTHLRSPAVDIAAAYNDVIAKACSTRAAWKAMRACDADPAARVMVAHESERTLVVTRVERGEAMEVSRQTAAAAKQQHARIQHSPPLTTFTHHSPAPFLQVAGLLGEQSETLWVEPTPIYHPLNVDATSITQSGATTNPVTPPSTAVGTHPIWDMGLHGTQKQSMSKASTAPKDGTAHAKRSKQSTSHSSPTPLPYTHARRRG